MLLQCVCDTAIKGGNGDLVDAVSTRYFMSFITKPTRKKKKTTEEAPLMTCMQSVRLVVVGWGRQKKERLFCVRSLKGIKAYLLFLPLGRQFSTSCFSLLLLLCCCSSCQLVCMRMARIFFSYLTVANFPLFKPQRIYSSMSTEETPRLLFGNCDGDVLVEVALLSRQDLLEGNCSSKVSA